MNGNPGCPGNPHVAMISQWRKALADAVTADDIRDVIGVWIDKVNPGKSRAVWELLDRCVGRVQTEPLSDAKPVEVLIDYVKKPLPYAVSRIHDDE